MMPWAKLNTAPVSSSHPPKMRKAARTRSVLGARRVSHSTATRPIREPGINHEICPPIEERNRRFHPVGPHMLPAAPCPPTLPVSLPVSRPKPL